MTIKTKLIIAITSSLLVVGVASALFQNYVSRQKLTEHANQDVKQSVDYVSQLVNFYFGRAQDNLTNLAKNPVIIDAMATKDAAKLNQASKEITSVDDAISILDNIGLFEIKDSTCVIVGGGKSALPLVGRDFSQRDYCKGVIQTNAPYFSSAFISAVTKKPVIVVAVPIKNNDGKTLGFIASGLDLRELRGYLADLQKDSSVVLLDRYGIMFLNTAEELDTLDSPPPAFVGDVQKRITAGHSEGSFQNIDDFVGYKPINSATIISERSNKLVSALSNYFNLAILISWAVALLSITICIYFFVGIITKKLSRLSKISQEIAAGKLDIQLSEKDFATNDETGVLAKSFNEMAIKIANTYKQLEGKIKERTAEIEAKSKRLESSDAELKKALEVAERSNNLMVNRELEMKKLKERIKELESRQ